MRILLVIQCVLQSVCNCRCLLYVTAEASGTDYVPVVSCLVQLALDPYCRTLHGFENLVEREWVALGHQFVERCALAASKDAEMVIFLLVSAEIEQQQQEQQQQQYLFNGPLSRTTWVSWYQKGKTNLD